MFTLYYNNEKFKNFLKKINSKSPKVNKLNPLLKKILNNNNIFFEKKKRYFIYNRLYYLFENYTYYDFFTNDIFNILKYTKYLIFLLKKSNINLNILNIIFLTLNKKKIDNLIVPINKSNFFKKENKFNNKILLKILNISYSHSIKNLFEKTLNNSLIYYKTPLISLENIIINLINFYPFIKNNQTYLYLIRYKLLKRLHKQENILHNHIKKNNHFFFYLIKKNSSNLLKNISINNLNNLITVYRNNLISFSLKLNFNKILQNEYYFYLLNNK